MFNQKTVDRLNELIQELKKGNKYPVEEMTLLLWNSNIGWDLAIEARARHEPKEFYDFYPTYKTATINECKAAMSKLEPALLASILCREGREVTYWNYGYDNDVNNFSLLVWKTS